MPNLCIRPKICYHLAFYIIKVCFSTYASLSTFRKIETWPLPSFQDSFCLFLRILQTVFQNNCFYTLSGFIRINATDFCSLFLIT